MQCDFIMNGLEPESANFFCKGSDCKSTLVAMWPLSQLLSSAIVMQKQP